MSFYYFFTILSRHSFKYILIALFCLFLQFCVSPYSLMVLLNRWRDVTFMIGLAKVYLLRTTRFDGSQNLMKMTSKMCNLRKQGLFCTEPEMSRYVTLYYLVFVLNIFLFKGTFYLYFVSFTVYMEIYVDWKCFKKFQSIWKIPMCTQMHGMSTPCHKKGIFYLVSRW